MASKQHFQFFPWPAAQRPRGNWYRTVQAATPLQHTPRPGDALTIKYPSGTTVRAKVFATQFDHDNNMQVIQLEALSTACRKHYVLVRGEEAPPVRQTHKKKKNWLN